MVAPTGTPAEVPQAPSCGGHMPPRARGTTAHTHILHALTDELLLLVLHKFGDTLVFEGSSEKCLLLTASQVCRRFRRLIHLHVATACTIRQPHSNPSQPTALSHLPLGCYSAVTSLDISFCLDWIQHPCLQSLVDLEALRPLSRLQRLHLRPILDTIDRPTSGRIKPSTEVLCWADGIMPRIWDRWMYATSPGIGSLLNVSTLSSLTALESVVFPITVRDVEDKQPGFRLRSVLPLTRLKELVLGRANLKDDDLVETLACITQLTKLSIGQCSKVSYAGLQALTGLQWLERLELFGCGSLRSPSDETWALLSKLSRLEALGLYVLQEGENVHFRQNANFRRQAIPMSSTAFRVFCQTMPQLRSLQLSGCRNFCDALPTLAYLTSLTLLELTGCPEVPRGVLGHVMRALPQLRSLYLRQFTGDQMSLDECSAITLLVKLRWLSLDSCGPKVPNADGELHPVCGLTSIHSLTELESLLLWRQNTHWLASPMGFQLFACLAGLTRLSLSCDSFPGDEAMRAIAQLPVLRTLEVICTAAVLITDAGLMHISRLQQLRNLDLSTAPMVTDAGVEHLVQLTNLQTFRLGGSQISDHSMHVLAGWRRLRNLALMGSRIGDEGLRALSACGAIKILDLGGCEQVTDAGLQLLVPLSDLRQLNLERCRHITNGGVDRFKESILAAGPCVRRATPCITVFF